MFVIPEDRCNGDQVTLHSSLKTPEERTRGVGEVIKSLGELIPGVRNEVLLKLAEHCLNSYSIFGGSCLHVLFSC